MKDKLEQFIEENRDTFDSFSHSESEKVWGKILEKRKVKPGSRFYLQYFSRAAVILVIFGLS